MTKITREQFQAAIESGIDAAKLHDTDYADRLREVGRTAKVSRVRGRNYGSHVKCPAEEVRIAKPWLFFEATCLFVMNFDRALDGVSGEVEVVDA